MQEKKECKDCDYDNAIRKGRAYHVCPKCGKDLTLELVLMYEAKHYENRNK